MQQPHSTDIPEHDKDLPPRAGRIAGSLGESAQQVWLAGIGALSRAQAEGSRLFEQLAEEGRGVADTGAEGKGMAARLEGLRQSMDATMDRTYARAEETWDSLGRLFERRVQQTLRMMDVPTRQDLDLLGARIDALALELRRSPQDTPPPPERRPSTDA